MVITKTKTKITTRAGKTMSTVHSEKTWWRECYFISTPRGENDEVIFPGGGNKRGIDVR
jgi:hypothetical protein